MNVQPLQIVQRYRLAVGPRLYLTGDMLATPDRTRAVTFRFRALADMLRERAARYGYTATVEPYAALTTAAAPASIVPGPTPA